MLCVGSQYYLGESVVWYNRPMIKKYEMPSVGEKFGELSVREVMGRNMNLDCSCGGEVLNINIGNLLNPKKPVRSCRGCSQKRVGKKNRGDNNESLRRRVWGSMKNNAKHRGIPLTISYDSFVYFVEGSCVYCGTTGLSYLNPLPHEDWKERYTYTGIDRIDSSLGYEEGNIQSCCKICNYAKLEMSEEKFFDWIGKVYNFNKKKFEKSID